MRSPEVEHKERVEEQQGGGRWEVAGRDLVGHACTVFGFLSEGGGKSLGSKNWSDLASMLKAYIYSSQACKVELL